MHPAGEPLVTVGGEHQHVGHEFVEVLDDRLDGLFAIGRDALDFLRVQTFVQLPLTQGFLRRREMLWGDDVRRSIDVYEIEVSPHRAGQA